MRNSTRRLITAAVVLSCIALAVAGGGGGGGPPPPGGPGPGGPGGFPRDPYLKFQPKYAYSLPIQILLNGIVVALLFVLLVHLIFTAQYHWALARTNYILQLSGVCTLLISQLSTLIIVLSYTYRRSRQWPYMLDYVAVTIPVGPNARIPECRWTRAQTICWYFMLFVNSGLVNATHIQFLTLLYPSRIERRLIIFLIGPLAVVSAGMEFCGLSQSVKAQDLGQAIRDICNSTLTLLFTCALFIWGFLLNRKQAWRTDGGTAVFGAGALVLAVISTVVNFVQIVEEELEWLPGLLWAVVLWQSFLGWWWWVGSGLGVGEVEDMILKGQQKKDSKMRKRHRRGSRRTQSQGDNEDPLDEPVLKRWKRGVLDASNHLSRRRIRSTTTTDPHDPNDDMTTPDRQIHHPDNDHRIPSASSSQHPISSQDPSQTITTTPTQTPERRPTSLDPPIHRHSDAVSTYTSTSGTPTPLPSRFMQIRPISSILQFWYKLRHAHQSAAQAQAIEQVELRAQRYGPESAELGGAGGWGLGNFGLREREEAERRKREFEQEQQAGQLRVPERVQGGDPTAASDDGAEIRPATLRSNSYQSGITSRTSTTRRTHPDPPWAVQESQSFWWWTPFRRWRQQDTTGYS